MSLRFLAATTIALISAGCVDGAGRDDDTVLVFAAASLTDVFSELETAFEAGEHDVEVQLNMAGSSTLRVQILEGAPADVFASADTANMERLAEAGELHGEPAVFAVNRMQIVVPAGNPGEVDGLRDFERSALLIGLCAHGVPCGDLARQALANAGIEPAVDTNEPDVRALLTKVAADELDAGIVYKTDVAAAVGRVEGVDIAEDHNVVAVYPIAALTRSGPAADFVAFTLSNEGRSILADYGFSAP